MATHVRRRISVILRSIGWLSVVLAASASAGIVRGSVHGAPPNTTLPIIKDGGQVGQITVGQDGTYSISLAPGTYIVQCPSGKKPSILALQGPVVRDIDC